MGKSAFERVKNVGRNVRKSVQKVVDMGTSHFASDEGLKQVKRAGRAISSVIPFQNERNLLHGLTGGAVGRAIGGSIGKAIGTLTGNRKKGRIIGENFAESTLGFKKGGRVKKSGKYLVHKKEFVVPKGGKVTKKQKSKIVKRQKKK